MSAGAGSSPNGGPINAPAAPPAPFEPGLRAVVDALPSQIGYWDAEMRIRFANRAYERIFGRERGQILGLHARELLGEAAFERVQPRMLAALRGEVQSYSNLWPGDGERIGPLYVQIHYLPDVAEGQVRGFYALVHDVTELTRSQHALAAALEKAEAASRAKSEFLANTSHEIRSPLNAVAGLAYLLAQTPMDAEQRGYLERIQLASRALLANVDDVLDIAKIEARELKLEQRAFSPAAAIADVVEVISINAEAKGLTVELSLDPHLPHRVLGDSTRSAQVVHNLIGNAVKFTERGSVRVRAEWQAALETAAAADEPRLASGWLRVRVQDTGVGIPEAALQGIFEPFVQADNSTTRRFGGTGLGLAIVKRLVDLMHGRVSVVSAVGRGSEFLVEIPFQTVAAGAGPDAGERVLAADALAGHTLLVVDDSDINRDVARRMLERKGARVLLACDGAQAVAQVGNAALGIALVLMDIHMPGMDGFEATRRIRRDLGLTRLPILALTAGATVAEREAARDAGVDEFISKPFDPTKLLWGIAERLGVKRLAARAGGAAGAADAAVEAGEVKAPGGPSAEDWPVIAGVNARDARERLGDDLTLYRVMLRRLFDQPLVLAWGPVGSEEGLEAAIHEAHKLAGTAGTLGLEALHGQALALEAALRARQLGPASAAQLALGAEWRRLKEACEALLAPEPAVAPTHPPGPAYGNASLAALELGPLLEMLSNHNLGAGALFAELADTLARHLPAADFARLREHMDNLRFEPAAQLLRQARGEGEDGAPRG